MILAAKKKAATFTTTVSFFRVNVESLENLLFSPSPPPPLELSHLFVCLSLHPLNNYFLLRKYSPLWLTCHDISRKHVSFIFYFLSHYREHVA
jgi:hypothetical protein